MFKRLSSLLLFVCLLICLSSCGIVETILNLTNTPFKSQTDMALNADENMSINLENSHELSNVEEPKENDTAPTQTPTDQTEPAGTTDQATHTHSYSNATCTSPKKCSCGETDGSALGHNFTPATCEKPKTCHVCGETDGSALGHNFTPATCEKPKTCCVCGTTEGDPEAHNYEDGICTVCNAVNEQSYVEAQIVAADKVFADHTKYNDALKIINVALQKCPNNSTLKDKKAYYQGFAPVNLCDLRPYKKSTAYIADGRSYDNLNNSYDRCVYKPHYNSSASATYDLGYKYNILKATVFMRSDCSGKTSGTIEIYGDGALLYQKKGIDPYGRPFDIEVDITGICDLEIVIKSDSGAYIFGLAKCILQRTAK